MTVMCDLNEKRLAHLKSLYPEVEGVTDYSHTLNGLGLDAVAIATSPMKQPYRPRFFLC